MEKKKENFFSKIWKAIKNEAVDLVMTFKNGDWKTRLSYLFMGAGNLFRGQWHRGIIFTLFEGLFAWYMWYEGGYWISMLFPSNEANTLGDVGPGMVYDEFYDTYVYSYNDNSFQILLYGTLSLFLIAAFIYTWRLNIKEAKKAQLKVQAGKKLNSLMDDIRSLLDEDFYKTLLFLPVTGIVLFTMLPIVFMVLVAFTNYDGTHEGYVTNLFGWVGFTNFKTLLSFGGNGYFNIFMSVLGWTLVWAFFATFTNYFLGIIVAMMINKKGIRFKKMWRTIFVVTIAIPQFISLLYVSKMFADSGIVNGWLLNLGWIDTPIKFWSDPTLARIMVVLINIWVGIPYLMLIATGILLNIPADLYESARIDGANPVQQFFHITMPYMLFVTAPYLLTSFIGNMNNFNVIYLLTSGGPTNGAASIAEGSVGYTDLLITWLFKITTGQESKYYMASVIGVAVFVVVSTITLVVYNVLPSTRNEEDMS